MASRIFLANVGANASHRFVSPIFPDRTFEFIPIPEDLELPGSHAVRYRELRSYQEPERDLMTYIPERLWDWPTHNDPEFDTFTYGDNCETSARAAGLKGLKPGDFLLFLAHLVEWERPGRTVSPQPNPGGQNGFYLIGYLEIEVVMRDILGRPTGEAFRRMAANAHVRRGLSQPGLWDGFWVFLGSGRSQRFRRAVPVTRDFASRVLTAADGSPWQWGNGRSDLQVIGSYTRSCRCVIDPALPGQTAKAEALWEWVARQSR